MIFQRQLLMLSPLATSTLLHSVLTLPVLTLSGRYTSRRVDSSCLTPDSTRVWPLLIRVYSSSRDSLSGSFQSWSIITIEPSSTLFPNYSGSFSSTILSDWLNRLGVDSVNGSRCSSLSASCQMVSCPRLNAGSSALPLFLDISRQRPPFSSRGQRATCFQQLMKYSARATRRAVWLQCGCWSSRMRGVVRKWLKWGCRSMKLVMRFCIMNFNLVKASTPLIPKPSVPQKPVVRPGQQRLILSNFPVTVAKEELVAVISTSLAMAGGCLQKGPPITLITAIPDTRQYLLLFRSEEQTENCLQLDGLVVDNKAIRLQRPPDANPSRKGKTLNLAKLDIKRVQRKAETGDNRLFVGNLPFSVSEEVLASILGEFGFLRSLHLARSRNNLGFAYFSYCEPASAQKCIQKLNGIVLQNLTLVVKRVPFQTDDNSEPSTRRLSQPTGQEQAQLKCLTMPLPQLPGSTLLLKGILQEIEPADIDRALKDVQRQMERIDATAKVTIDEDGEGVLVGFRKKEHAGVGLVALQGRKFNGRAVVVECLSY